MLYKYMQIQSEALLSYAVAVIYANVMLIWQNDCRIAIRHKWKCEMETDSAWLENTYMRYMDGGCAYTVFVSFDERKQEK